MPRPSLSRRLTSGTAAFALATTAVLVPVAAASAAPAIVRTDAGWSPYGGQYPAYPSYPSSPGSATATTTAGLDVTAATESQSSGLVLVSSTIGYGTGTAAGTGMVLESDGLVVTNHHVVEGATSVEVTVATTGETYDATVVGTDSRRDVAVLQLEDASGLTTVTTSTDGLSTGDAITAVGDAGGDGGDLTAAAGTVTDLRDSITVSDEAGGSSDLRNLIQIDADIIGGDSGGALLDSDGDVVGMNVAASSGTAEITGYVIPIARVLRVVDRIVAGDEGGSIVLGVGGRLGVGTSIAAGGATVAEVADGTPAASLGLEVGDVITAVDGTAVSSSSQLSELIGGHDAGDRVTITWTDSTGATRSGTVTLAVGAVR
ncbi:S1-C subfamily serine protease [Nocardioides sp. BE266]|uniref:S1C family serine protease n=1 Tax=Nocardioides sp. BE266 TaxID=2817725 RepID=UPI002857E674|nr:trypsin-like peptidase domain-containing protein [Nocardioides sp. BE266]MDR7252916.1 S1-C subfamily serine protease [Nocardioides sp. BE266]